MQNSGAGFGATRACDSIHFFHSDRGAPAFIPDLHGISFRRFLTGSLQGIKAKLQRFLIMSFTQRGEL
jgi:hypothetical protein